MGMQLRTKYQGQAKKLGGHISDSALHIAMQKQFATLILSFKG